MKTAIISIGDELLNGDVVNTNAHWLSAQLITASIPVSRIVCVPDSEKDILSEFRKSWKENDIVITTGGLGPTHDDITVKCIAKFFNTTLVENAGILRHIKTVFRRRKIEPPESVFRQALVPANAVILTNTGTAPGLFIRKRRKYFCALPGVPQEVKYIVNKSELIKIFSAFNSRNYIFSKTLHTFGAGESVLSELIGNVEKNIRKNNNDVLKLAFLPSGFEVRIRITAESVNLHSAKKLLNQSLKLIKSKISKYIYSCSGKTLQETVASLLVKRKKTVSAAESCTGGLFSSKLTDVSGSSDYFLYSAVTYSNKSKIKLLGCNPGSIKIHGAVSRVIAEQMAYNIRKFSGSDIGISITGIAGPSGASKNKPVGSVWIGYSDASKNYAEYFVFTKDRLRNKEAMSKTALNILRKELMKND